MLAYLLFIGWQYNTPFRPFGPKFIYEKSQRADRSPNSIGASFPPALAYKTREYRTAPPPLLGRGPAVPVTCAMRNLSLPS